MRLLLDQNLSFKLCRLLADLFPGSDHVRLLGLANADLKEQKAERPIEISPGPNNPVGLVWIALSAPSYGIHGTPEPDKISKTADTRT
jgi:hypothetical protein